MASQFTLTPEKKKRIADANKRSDDDEDYDPKAPEAPNRAVPLRGDAPIQPIDLKNQSIRERVASIPRSIATSLGADMTYANRLGEDAASFADFIPGVGEGIGAQETYESAKAGDWKGTALNAAGTLAGVAPVGGDIIGKGIKSLAKKGGREALVEAKAGIKAYHGSPHDFDEFRLDKIGTGEGAQAYGHGLYFAENEGIAKSYRDALTDAKDVYYHGSRSLRDAEENAANILMASKDKQDALDWIDQRRGSAFADPEWLDQTAAAVKRFNKNDLRVEREKNPGSMYEVNIKADPEHFLDWDKPLSEQSPKAAGALDAELKRYLGRSYDGQIGNYKDQSAGAILQDTGAVRGDNFAKQSGIPGIKYLDAGSRSAGDGSRNYVVFDPKIIEIVKKYGIGAALAAGLISEEMARQMQAQQGGSGGRT